MQIQQVKPYAPNFSRLYQVGKAGEPASLMMEMLANTFFKKSSVNELVKAFEDNNIHIGLSTNKAESKIKVRLYGGDGGGGLFPLKSGRKGFSTEIGCKEASNLARLRILTFIEKAADDIFKLNRKLETNLDSKSKQKVIQESHKLLD